MHSALLIDEILELVLDGCSDWDKKEYQHAAIQLSQTCTSMKDPALDRVWRNLSDPRSLTKLLGDGGKNSRSASTFVVPPQHAFHSYAARVKHLSFRDRPPAVVSETPLLPNLTSVVLNRAGCETPVAWVLSEHLRSIEVVIGTLNVSCRAQTRGANVADLLRQWAKSFPHASLDKLHIQGWMCPTLVRAITFFPTLRSLSLLSGKSVSSELLRAISVFPYLQELKVHASGIDIDDFKHFTPIPDDTTFPQLRILSIVGSHPVVRAILELLQPDTLEDLAIEIDQPTHDTLHWKPTLEFLAMKAHRSLRQLDISDVALDDYPDDNAKIGSTFTIETLRPLSALGALRSFSVEGELPPTLTNKDIEDMTVWWPRMQHLFLGIPFLDQTSRNPWQAGSSPAILDLLARRWPRLQSLTIPIHFSPNPTNAKPESTELHRSLRYLCVSCSATSDLPSTFVQDALAIFPSLELIECDAGHDMEPLFTLAGQTTGGKDEGAATVDEQANGC